MLRSGYNGGFSRQIGKGKREPMRESEEVSAMLRLHALGWGVRRIAAALGVSKNTVKRYLRQGGWVGFARARCPDCGHDFLVAFSCKGRGLCPSSNARRMTETAAHLVDHVFPPLPVRQWVLSVPKRLRWPI